MIAAEKARAKLDKTPATEVASSPFLRSVKFKGLTGTGLAQPKIKLGLPPDSTAGRINKAGTKIVPTGSMWGMGFKVSLPYLSAV